ncbi:AAA family ATPase [Methylobacter sp.]|uniref:AAA family ATPase n=1 Tax=Methylobacter sp. TaxID=2051955 RepID=UPI0034407EC0
MQKLDLLIHLLSNLTQALVVCGPEGIGKTTLLNVLQARKTESWRYCLIQGHADLSFEAIYDQLAQCIKQDKTDAPVKSLSMAFKQYENQHKQIIVIVDNAGELVPGLATAIIQYAAANPVLRLIFALTHDELQVKRGSDRAVDDCHIIEIPPLFEKQCGDFLQHLSTKPYANLSFKAIDENMVAHIYRETHGVPGRIIAEISGLSSAKQSGKLKWILVLAIAAAIAIAIGVQLLTLSNNSKEEITPNEQKKASNIEAIPQRPESQIVLPLPPAQPVIPQQQSLPASEGNEALKPPPVDDQQSVNSIATPEPVSAMETAQKQDNKQAGAVQQKIAEPLAEASPEKPRQLEISKTVNNVEQPNSEKLENKVQSAPASAIAPKPDNGLSVVAQQKIAEPPVVARQEEPKQAEISKTVNNVEPVMFNALETIQLPQKPVEVAPVPEQPVLEAAAPQQVESDGSWASPTNSFTLQLMVLSKQSSTDDMLKKYPAMGPDIRVINTFANGKEKFILEYGSYPDAASANRARQSLPFEFHKALVRKINSKTQR